MCARVKVRAGSSGIFLVATLVAGAFGSPLHAAPTYKEMPVKPPSARGWSKMLGTHNGDSSTVKQMCRGNIPLVVDTLDSFCNDLLFPQFTLVEENVLTIDPKTKGASEHVAHHSPGVSAELLESGDRSHRERPARPTNAQGDDRHLSGQLSSPGALQRRAVAERDERCG